MQVLFTSFKLVWDGQWWGRGWGTRGVGGAVVGVEKNGNGSWTMVSENDAPSSPPTRSIVPTHRRDVFKSFKMAWGWTSVGGGRGWGRGVWVVRLWERKERDGGRTTMGGDDAPSSPLTHNRPHTPTRRLQIVQNCVGVDVGGGGGEGGDEGCGWCGCGSGKNGTEVGRRWVGTTPHPPPPHTVVFTHRRNVFKSFNMVWGWTMVGGGSRGGTRGVGGAVVGTERRGRRSYDDG